MMIKIDSNPADKSKIDFLPLNCIRLKTRSRHDKVESAMPLGNQIIGTADYVKHLEIMANWLIPIENWLRQFSDGPQSASEFEQVFYSVYLRSDLSHFTQNFVFSDEVFKGSYQDSNYRLGILYVIEGAQLGGNVLLKRFGQQLPSKAVSFLQPKFPGRWGQFGKLFNDQIKTTKQFALASRGACDAFDRLIDILERK